MWIFLPYDPCPCGSRIKALACCLGPEGYFRRPALVRRPQLCSNFAREGCFLKFWGDCSPRLSGEHYVSESVIRATIPFALAHENTIQVRHPKMGPELRDVGIARLTAKILCSSHNGMFSPLDAQAGELWSTMRSLIDVDIDPQSRPRFSLFNGHDIERWMLKTLLGSFFSGYETQVRGARLPAPLGELAQKLLDIPLWNNNSGLYVDANVQDADNVHSYAFCCTYAPDGMIVSADFYMFGIRMILLPCPVDDASTIMPASARHRPDGFAFRIGTETKFIGFSWNHRHGSDKDWIQLERGPLMRSTAA